MTEKAQFAGFWIRAVADFLDSLFLSIATCLFCLMLLGGIFWIRVLILRSGQDEVSFLGVADPFVLQVFLVMTRIFLSGAYFTWGTFRFGSTFGKKTLGLQVISADGPRMSIQQSFFRWLGYGVSYFPLGAGFLMAGVHPQNCALHDLLAHTRCILLANPRSASSRKRVK